MPNSIGNFFRARNTNTTQANNTPSTASDSASNAASSSAPSGDSFSRGNTAGDAVRTTMANRRTRTEPNPSGTPAGATTRNDTTGIEDAPQRVFETRNNARAGETDNAREVENAPSQPRGIFGWFTRNR